LGCCKVGGGVVMGCALSPSMGWVCQERFGLGLELARYISALATGSGLSRFLDI
jgi:hypothetical protein